MPPELLERGLTINGVLVVSFLVSIPVAFAVYAWAFAIWSLIPLFIVLVRMAGDRRAHERGAARERHRPAYPLDGERRHRGAGRRRDLGRRAGLDVVALTDHDTAHGWAEAAAAAARHGVALVRGMEISCSRYGRSIHLLGYLVDPDHPGLADRDRVCPRGAGQPAAADGREDGGGRHPPHL